MGGLSQRKVGDEDLSLIGKLSNLRKLNLANNPHAGIGHLSGLNELRFVNLYRSSISDQGLGTLKSLEKLQSLSLWQTEETEAGVELLKKKRPDINIIMGQFDSEKSNSKNADSLLINNRRAFE